MNNLFRSQPGSEYYFHEGCSILELLNDSADPDASIARARVGVGVTTEWHRLRDTVERYVILEGSGEARVGDELPLEVGPGDVALIPATVRQCISNTGEKDLIFLAICTPRFVEENYIPS